MLLQLENDLRTKRPNFIALNFITNTLLFFCCYSVGNIRTILKCRLYLTFSIAKTL